MNFHFEVDGKILKRKKPHHHHKKEFEDLFCSFTFLTREWKHIEKYAIFWSRTGKSFIEYLGKGYRTKCPIPKQLKNSSVFYVQIYANDSLFTQKIDVVTKNNSDDLEECNKALFNHFLEEANKKIDDIQYSNNRLLIYVGGELFKILNITDDKDVTENNFNELFDARAELWTQDIIDEINKL